MDIFYISYQIGLQNYKKYLILSILFCTFVMEIIFNMKKSFLFVLLFVLLTLTLYSQPMKIMTYNVENLFDTQHDSLKNDKEYLPNSDLRWTNSRFYDKLHEVMQVIIGLGGDEIPLLIGLCEVENDFVLKAMTQFDPYDQLGYDYVHYEGPDARGIDVALLYQKDKFTPLASRPIPVHLPNGQHSRDLLYTCGALTDSTFLHIIQVHFPSRREGALASEPNRVAAAKAVRKAVEEIQMVDSQAGIVIMGDFNDNPSDKVPTTTLAALPYTCGSFEDLKLYNLCWDGYPFENREIGSYFHDGEWDMLDQIIVSGALLNGNLSVRIMPEAEVYHPKWISKRDKRTGEMVPKRTYVGPFYQGGVSDHFPVFIEIFFKSEL